MSADDRALEERLKREARLMALYIQNYREEGGHSAALLKWILGVLGSILVTAIGGAIIFYGSVNRLQSSFDAWREAFEKRLDRIEDRLDGRSGTTRGTHDSNSP